MKRVNWHIPEAAGVNVWPNVPPTRVELTSRVMSHRNFSLYLSICLSVSLSICLFIGENKVVDSNLCRRFLLRFAAEFPPLIPFILHESSSTSALGQFQHKLVSYVGEDVK